MKQSIQIVTAVNDENVVRLNLLRSHCICSGATGLSLMRGAPSAAAAYNAALDHLDSEYVALVHQDVYLPQSWFGRLERAIGQLEAEGEEWGVLGVWGVCADGRWAGKVWCSGGNQEHSGLGGTQPVASIDEVVIILNNRHGLRFDEGVPGFHLYATDIVCQARQRGLKSFVFEGPVVHNSRCNLNVYDHFYRRAYRYMQGKWRDQLPLLTCVAPVTRNGHWAIRKRWIKAEIRRLLGLAKSHARPKDPVDIAERLGYEREG